MLLKVLEKNYRYVCQYSEFGLRPSSNDPKEHNVSETRYVSVLK
jgi:hypothetical protein